MIRLTFLGTAAARPTVGRVRGDDAVDVRLEVAVRQEGGVRASRKRGDRDGGFLGGPLGVDAPESPL